MREGEAEGSGGRSGWTMSYGTIKIVLLLNTVIIIIFIIITYELKT